MSETLRGQQNRNKSIFYTLRDQALKIERLHVTSYAHRAFELHGKKPMWCFMASVAELSDYFYTLQECSKK